VIIDAILKAGQEVNATKDWVNGGVNSERAVLQLAVARAANFRPCAKHATAARPLLIFASDVLTLLLQMAQIIPFTRGEPNVCLAGLDLDLSRIFGKTRTA
jgi:hypothetical protein